MAIVCWSSKFRPLFSGFQDPQFIARLFLSTAGLLLFRLLGNALEILPGSLCIRFDLPLAFLLIYSLGPVGLWALILSTCIYSYNSGLHNSLETYDLLASTFVGWLFFQYCYWKTAPKHKAVWLIIFLVYLFLHAAFWATSYSASRLYPFGYIYMLSILHHTLFLGLVYIPFSLWFEDDQKWKLEYCHQDLESPSGIRLILIGLALICTLTAAGLSWFVYDESFTRTILLGDIGSPVPTRLGYASFGFVVLASLWPDLKVEKKRKLDATHVSWQDLIR